ncbi:MAG: hypothetical protein RLZ98_1308 [Pseudomonadota bacterium]|jgi:uncharacterized membrane protein YdfJ with MMPL/SSD domain
MFNIPRKRPWPPVLETSTVRSELARIRHDLEQVPDLRVAAMIIAEAIEELENAEARSQLGERLLRFDVARFRRKRKDR